MPDLNVREQEKILQAIDDDIAKANKLLLKLGMDRPVNRRLAARLDDLKKKRDQVLETLTRSLGDSDILLLARHPNRPYCQDYIRAIFEPFFELHGDRLLSDDSAIIGGLGTLNGQQIMVIGHQKGHSTSERIKYNFGMAKPGGYHKAFRLAKLAEKFCRPIVFLVDTPAADPGVVSESQGIGQAIAHNLANLSLLNSPIIVAIIGEGGSGGAIGIGIGDRILMFENAIFSIIPPESCAEILWRDRKRMDEATDMLKLTSKHALRLGIIDEIIPEPLGGAHRDHQASADLLKKALLKHLTDLTCIPIDQLINARYRKYRQIGVYNE